MPHRSEESFRELELGLEQAERTGQVGSWSWNLDGTTLSWSEGTYRVFGLRREEFVPTPDSFFAAIHPLDRERTKRVIMDALQLQSACEVEFRISRPAGMIRWVRATTRLLTGEGGRALCISGTLQDVTEEHRLRDQVRLSQRRELLGLLASGIAHDFNNLLTVIRGRSEMVLDEPALSPNGQDSLRQVLEAVDRAAGLTRQLTGFGRSQVAQIQSCDVNKVINHLAKMLRRIIGEHINVQLNLAAELPNAEADPGLVEHLLMHLAVVARDAMPNGGDFIVTTEAVSQVQPGQRPRPFVRLIVAHTGGGFSPDDLAAAADPAVEREERARTMGLGLAAACHIVEQLRSRIECAAVPPGGSGLRVDLPAAAPASDTPQGNQTKTPFQGGSERILLVEDDQGMRTFVSLFLSRLGYKVREAPTGTEAIRVWKNHRGEFDLLLTDVVMPGGMNGLELAKQLRQEKPSLRIIAMSGYGEAGAAEPGIERVAKPFTPESLAHAIRLSLNAAKSSS